MKRIDQKGLRAEFNIMDKEAIKQIHNYKCSICGKIIQNGHIHHIIPIYKANINNYLEINQFSNLTYLCFKCHKKQHNFLELQWCIRCPVCKNHQYIFKKNKKWLIRICLSCGYENKVTIRKFIGLNYFPDSPEVKKATKEFFSIIPP